MKFDLVHCRWCGEDFRPPTNWEAEEIFTLGCTTCRASALTTLTRLVGSIPGLEKAIESLPPAPFLEDIDPDYRDWMKENGVT